MKKLTKKERLLYIIAWVIWGLSILVFSPLTILHNLSYPFYILTNKTLNDKSGGTPYCGATCLSKEIKHYHSFIKAFWHMMHKCRWCIFTCNGIIEIPLH